MHLGIDRYGHGHMEANYVLSKDKILFKVEFQLLNAHVCMLKICNVGTMEGMSTLIRARSYVKKGRYLHST